MVTNSASTFRQYYSELCQHRHDKSAGLYHTKGCTGFSGRIGPRWIDPSMFGTLSPPKAPQSREILLVDPGIDPVLAEWETGCGALLYGALTEKEKITRITNFVYTCMGGQGLFKALAFKLSSLHNIRRVWIVSFWYRVRVRYSVRGTRGRKTPSPLGGSIEFSGNGEFSGHDLLGFFFGFL